MNTKTYRTPTTKMVPQLDDDGYFMGFSVADESPMIAGLWDLAHNAIDAKAPPREAVENEAIRWTGTDWAYEPDYSQAELYSTVSGEVIKAKRGQSLNELNATLDRPQPHQSWNKKKKCWSWSIAQLKEQKLAELSAMRWDIQSSGVIVDSVQYASSPDDVARLKSTLDDMQAAELETVTFKAANGWTKLNAAQLKKVYTALVQYTQACYTAEYEHTQQINASKKAEDIEGYNLQSGWPV